MFRVQSQRDLHPTCLFQSRTPGLSQILRRRTGNREAVDERSPGLPRKRLPWVRSNQDVATLIGLRFDLNDFVTDTASRC